MAKHAYIFNDQMQIMDRKRFKLLVLFVDILVIYSEEILDMLVLNKSTKI